MEEQAQGTGSGIMASRWRGAGAELALTFRDASPFPHVVLDDFLNEDFAFRLLKEFPSVDAMPKSRDYMFGNKRELSSIEGSGPAGAALYQHMMSPEFGALLTAVAGTEVLVDPAFFGGGFHQGADGSYLDTHVDFNLHPLHNNWLRTLNILLYLNPDWKTEYGGELLIRVLPEDEPTAISPIFNRAVVMLTDRHTFHGYKKMALPPGVTRKSIAAYAYQVMAVGQTVEGHTTGWVPENAGFGKRLIARHYDTMVRLKNKHLGSRTARNR